MSLLKNFMLKIINYYYYYTKKAKNKTSTHYINHKNKVRNLQYNRTTYLCKKLA